ncbi:MoaD/ThiS family protein [Stenotrophomonas sp. YIM B06876]|uniref:MoaD/ThiS family protein n=1 Tax=Stenotrophomonas sp. YIM B06876 TaxID=3060211 RepID=UPI00273A4730|nr:MoaD/ThiS family protein [Stenotrophomonas sp. YIM B06876]
MHVTVELFGSFSDLSPDRELQLEVVDGACVSDLRSALHGHLQTHFPQFRAGLLRVCVFADSQRILRDPEPLPADGRVSILPPVSGG